MKRSAGVRLSWAILVALALIVGFLLLASAWLPFPTLKSILDSLAADGQLESFTPAFYQAIRPLAIALGLAWLAAGALLIYRKGSFQNWLERLPGGMARLIRRLGGDFRLLFRFLAAQFSDKKYLVGLAVILLIASAIRLVYSETPIRYDEAYTFLVFAMRPLRFITTDYHVPNNHIFHTILVRLAYLAFGSQLWSIRLPVLVSGILLVPAAYLAGKLFFERRTALLSAALIAASSILVEFSTNARGYMIISLLGLLILILAACLKTNGNLAAWMLLIIFSVLGFYTVPVFLYPFGMVMSWLLVSAVMGDLADSQNRWRFLRSLVFAGLFVVALTLLVYLPVFRTSGVDALTGNRYVSAVEGAVFMENTLVRFRNSWLEWQRDLPAWAGWFILLGLVVSTVFNRRLSTQRVPFLIPAACWIGAVLVIQQVTPWPRVWLFLLPFVLIWASGGLVGFFRLLRLPRPVVSRTALDTVFVVLVVCLAAGLSWRVYQAQSIGQPARAYAGATSDEEAIARYLQETLQPGDVVATAIPFNYPLRYYFLRNHVPFTYFYRKSDDAGFQRALVVVSQGYGQSLEQVLAYTRLGEDAAPEDTARLLYQYRTTEVYEIAPK